MLSNVLKNIASEREHTRDRNLMRIKSKSKIKRPISVKGTDNVTN